ncbi:hypothetical protein EO087_06925 [Dyella sp. M7H15-1]|uniref:hypothetical protein n=1 Tax=Dyella sp. M7H15-1 TaxID=2501295 RepID=UPI001004F946|nr:hypothetical protein [Dyella sp. M7H15-1]QAU23747.1 hypothetical protein EO087_06925 [Dyella sp. M7H15-1]
MLEIIPISKKNDIVEAGRTNFLQSLSSQTRDPNMQTATTPIIHNKNGNTPDPILANQSANGATRETIKTNKESRHIFYLTILFDITQDRNKLKITDHLPSNS